MPRARRLSGADGGADPVPAGDAVGVRSGARMSTRSSAGFLSFSSGPRFISLYCHAPWASPSAMAWPASAGPTGPNASVGRWNAARGTPSVRARFAAADAARRMLARDVSSGLPSPRSSTRAAGPVG